MITDLLSQRRAALLHVVQDSYGVVLQTDAWLLRVLPPADAVAFMTPVQIGTLTDIGDVSYAGLPRVAALGYLLGDSNTTPMASMVHAFQEGMGRLMQRPGSKRALTSDDVALLGIADGLLRIAHLGGDIAVARQWVVSLVNEGGIPRWSDRMRSLAGELLDPRGRLHVLPAQDSADDLALDLSLRAAWPAAFHDVPLPTFKAEELLRVLITEPVPDESERSAAWLRCIDVLIRKAARQLTHTVPDTVHILQSVQHAFKRWPYEQEPHRKGILPVRWIIDNEYQVQSLLWAILYPIYNESLVDEVYVEDWSNKKPRIDLGITSLKLIIEVKIARSPRDFTEIEEQVAGDVGLYFKNPARFNRMVVFVYDDCDEHHPEKYDSLRNALIQREEIEDVVIVRRPSRLPNQKTR
ncbi:MAG: hypothetical protein WCK70_03310 [Chloroflexales bacterium]